MSARPIRPLIAGLTPRVVLVGLLLAAFSTSKPEAVDARPLEDRRAPTVQPEVAEAGIVDRAGVLAPDDVTLAAPDSNRLGKLHYNPPMDAASVAKRARSVASDVVCRDSEPFGP